MELVVVERQFEAPARFVDLQAKEDAARWCLATHRVRFLRSYLARDGHHMVCLYEAPDAEAVRETQRVAGLPVRHVYKVVPVLDRRMERPPGHSLVVAQRALPKGVSLADVEYAATDPTGCGQRLRLTHFGAFVSPDCSRMCCVYYSPDLESVRLASREGGVPYERVWSGEELPRSAD